MDSHHDHHHPNTDYASKNDFFVKVSPQPPFSVKEKVTLELSVTDTDSNQPVPLKTVHEEKMHLIFVSHDFKTFIHKHPIQIGSDYHLDLAFERETQYTLFADYTPEQQSQEIGRFDFQVGQGNDNHKEYPSEMLNWEEEGYSVVLNIPEDVEAGKTVMLSAFLSYKSEEISNLQQHLGSLAHIVIISDDVKDFLHVHPMESKTMGPKIEFHTHFPKSGRYHLFLEFKHSDTITVAHFVIAV